MKKPEIAFGKQGSWEAYAETLNVEYQQCLEEGKDIAGYQALFEAVQKMPVGRHKAKIADILFDLQFELPVCEDYPYNEPNELERIRALRPEWKQEHEQVMIDEHLEDQILGAWFGRTCGCLLGKPIEGIRTDMLYPLLQESDNWPLKRYIVSSDISDERKKAFPFFTESQRQCWADVLDGAAPADDDTNYTVLYQLLLERYGRDFTSDDVARIWVSCQSKDAYCTAERVAFCNFVKGYRPPDSAVWQNPYREWIGAQIRADYFGYINPGNPELAAEMAWRDACISHVKNGIYGEMFVAAMIAQAAVEKRIDKIIEAGLAQIPANCRLSADIHKVMDAYHSGMTQQKCHKLIHSTYNEHSSHDWCHTISNAMIVVMALLYGEGDYSKSICMAVQSCFDTDCNGATVGSILGMRDGTAAIDDKWLEPINGKLDTAIFGVGTVELKEIARKTMKHVQV